MLQATGALATPLWTHFQIRQHPHQHHHTPRQHQETEHNDGRERVEPHRFVKGQDQMANVVAGHHAPDVLRMNEWSKKNGQKNGRSQEKPEK
jgi:hypothetical protein